ncbi:MAG: hypothetical protein LAP38_09010 [Acidobacteriia bacterium]|nr:hypothetical protein [Terriglobia bacterium]
MRLASRVIGTFAIAVGCVPFVILCYVTFTEGWSGPIRQTLAVVTFLVAIGVGLIMAGRYYLRFDPDAPEQVKPDTPQTQFLVLHRRQLKVLAESGLALAIIRLASACFHNEWPGRWADWPLVLGAIGLLYCGRKMASPDVTDNSDWQRVPGWIRNSLPRIHAVATWGALLLILLNQWSRVLAPWPALQSLAESESHRSMLRILFLVCLTAIYAAEVLFFTYGELRET